MLATRYNLPPPQATVDCNKLPQLADAEEVIDTFLSILLTLFKQLSDCPDKDEASLFPFAIQQKNPHLLPSLPDTGKIHT